MRTFLLASLFAFTACQGNATTDNHSLWGSLTANVASVGYTMTRAVTTAAVNRQTPAEATALVSPDDPWASGTPDPWAQPTAEVTDHVDTVAVSRALLEELPGA